MNADRKNLGLAPEPAKRRRRYLVLALVLSASATGASGAIPTNQTDHELLKLSLEQLMTMKVTSVSRKEETLSQTAAAISVITPDDVRRSGVTTIPDALRLAPGVDVGRVDAHTWAVGVRGLNDTFSPSLLTLIDGRSIYSPLFSGTIWMAQDVMLEDLNRIEVIRGPGSTVWGANAFNGVINIVTKPANETQGLLASGSGGTQQLGSGALRYGDKLGTDTFYRIYGKYDQWDNLENLSGNSANDQWWKMQGGFRLDHLPAGQNEYTLQGDVYHLNANQDTPVVSLAPPGRFSQSGTWEQTGGNILGRWTRHFSDKSELNVQAYYDGERLETAVLGETRNTVDLDVRHQFQWGGRQEIVWGGGYRLIASSFRSSAEVSLMNDSRADHVFNAFVQNEINVVPERVRFTIGTKLEHNDYTAFEVEPGARLAWTPTEKQTVWASVSRAVRTPSQIEDAARINLTALPPAPPATPETLLSVAGNPNMQSEQLTAYELGYRVQPHARLTLDASAFVHSYVGLRASSDSLNPSTLPAYLQVISTLGNFIDGETYGTEMSATWQATDNWRLIATYSLLESHLHQPDNAITGQPQPADAHAPEHQASLRSNLSVTRDIDFDIWVRYAGAISDSSISIPGNSFSSAIPSHFTLDARIAWRPCKNLELSIVGQNLVGSAHREFNPTFMSTQATQVSRSVFGKLVWSF
jgi:iron complex outermembrane receptor protein